MRIGTDDVGLVVPSGRQHRSAQFLSRQSAHEGLSPQPDGPQIGQSPGIPGEKLGFLVVESSALTSHFCCKIHINLILYVKQATVEGMDYRKICHIWNKFTQLISPLFSFGLFFFSNDALKV
jgi:hypothetical protein